MDEIIKTANSPSEAENSSIWLMIGTLYLNSALFKRGIVVLSPNIPEESICDGDTSFTLNARRFSFYTPTNTCSQKPHASSLTTARAFITELTSYAHQTSQDLIHNRDQSVLFNHNRREEIFLPLQIAEESTYIYPWTTKAIKKFEFTGFKRFVTAGCMFGSKLQGITNDEECIELINHHLMLRPHQKIMSIAYDCSLKSPYEEVIFHEFEKNCCLARSLTTQNETTHLLYHLPTEDYILFGIKLALQQKMTLAALRDFIEIIIAHQHEYQERLTSIANNHHIELQFGSPFMHLFSKELDFTTDAILAQLDFTHTSSEKEFVNSCIHKLTSSTENNLSLIWQDFINIETTPPESIEDLFKIGNAVLSALASQGQDHYQTCSILPLSEKQIQVQYELCRKKRMGISASVESNKYPAQFNITTLDPVITYSPTTQGLLFYFSHSLGLLSTLVSEKKIVSRASSQLKFFHPEKINHDLTELQEQYKHIK
ncbi:MAG: hypothetical protein CK426_06715 [Legionella sp.]|nr:MAG: hypothetical protein CK423_06685 [Legionella sp.]PJD98389.1 MAG: hypothetical protein CK426_06715 [Legionella sp.]